MSNFSSLKAAIQQYIKTNGNEEITGAVLQDILLSIVSVLGDTAINDLETALQTETTNRTNADGTLQGNIDAEATARENADGALSGRLTTVEGAITTINTKLAEGYLYAGIATASTNPGSPTAKVFYLATAAGTYTNFLDSGSSALVLTHGINVLKYNGTAWSQEQVYGVDDVPTAGSNNLVQSGGVASELRDIRLSIDGEVFERTGAMEVADAIRFNDGVIEKGKTYLLQVSLNVADPTDTAFQLCGWKSGVGMTIFAGMKAEEEKTVTIPNEDFSFYYYRIRQAVSSGSIKITRLPCVSAEIEKLESDVNKSISELDFTVNGIILNENRSYTQDEYLRPDFVAGKTYRLISNVDYSGLAMQIMCKLNGVWTVVYGFNGVSDRIFTIPSNSQGNAIWIRENCSGTIKVIDQSAVSPTANEAYKASVVETVIIKANSDINSGADFVGNTAIQQAFDSITDASPNKRYIIQATGEFIANNLNDYQAQRTQYVFIKGKDYVDLEGVSKDNCIIRCSLPNSLASNQSIDPNFTAADYAKYQPLWWDFNGNIKNVTLIARNIRYPLHIDSSSIDIQNNITIDVENCNLVHEGKYGDSVGSVGGSSVGFAVSQGMTLNLKHCSFQDAYGAPYGHDNKEHKIQGVINYIDCEFIHNAPAFNNDTPEIHFECLSKYEVASIMNVNGCLLPKGMRVRGIQTNLDTIKRNADSICNIINLDSYPMAQNEALVSTIGLKITSNSTASPSSVRVDHTSSAFDAIFGYSSEKAIQMNTRCCRERQYGYEYKDGGNGMQGYAIGTRNVSQALIGGTSYANHLGKRLGDCSVTNKTLTVFVDGVSHNIVFNKNYNGTAENVAPNYSNADIIAEMNTALSGYATVGYYSLDNDWMPNYLKGFDVRFNTDSTFIEHGMGVVFNGTGVKKAKRSDARIDGIALDSAPVGGDLRIITGGSISYQDVRYSINKAAGSPDISTLSYMTKLSISSSDDGVFEVSDAEPVANIGFGNEVVF